MADLEVVDCHKVAVDVEVAFVAAVVAEVGLNVEEAVVVVAASLRWATVAVVGSRLDSIVELVVFAEVELEAAIESVAAIDAAAVVVVDEYWD